MKRSSLKYDQGADRVSRVMHSLSLIEDALEPLIVQTISPSADGRRTHLAGAQQKKVDVFKLVGSLVDSIDAFIECSSEIFKEYAEINSEILIEIEKLRSISRR